MTISLTTARRHLRIDGTQDDDEIQLHLTMADTLIGAYLGDMNQEEYDAWPLPDRQRYEAALTVAMMLIIGETWSNRESSTSCPLSDSVKNILNMFRRPTCA